MFCDCVGEGKLLFGEFCCIGDCVKWIGKGGVVVFFGIGFFVDIEC